ncbi:hypothetical protein O181_055886 [Austropuccinia psidii MF-1]|uniref:Uncharacterized protein n=1 Tax=Austropuccinia psidii MF-1 TaxID=1389203 RepID=A0A9Q3EC87_9BASI|nr:hypothetical protein [Austropuccinia psidii MF-1]
MLDCLGLRSRKSIHCDNQAAVSVPTDNSLCKKMRYLLQASFFVNDVICTHNIDTMWVSTSKQHANILTKPLPGPSTMVARGQIIILGGGVMTRAIAWSSRSIKIIPVVDTKPNAAQLQLSSCT